jgi:hypothetical protein
MNFGLVTVWKPNFPAGLTRFIGFGRVKAGLRLFPYPGAVGLAGLRSDKAKPSPRAGFSLILKPGLG